MTKAEMQDRVDQLEADKAQLIELTQQLTNEKTQLLTEEIPKLEGERDGLKLVVAEMSTQIAQYQNIAAEAVQLRDVVAENQLTIADLQARLSQVKDMSAFTELGKGWLGSSIGQRVTSDESTIDQTPFLLGIIAQDFSIIKMVYTSICTKLATLGRPASRAEQLEIQQLMKRCGFA